MHLSPVTFLVLSILEKLAKSLYPFGSQRKVFSTFDQNFDFKKGREHKKNSYERRAYEPVDVRSLFWVYIPLVYGKQYSGSQRVMTPLLKL